MSGRKRYPTYLTRTKSDRQPTRMGALAVRSSVGATEPGSVSRELHLSGWELETWSVRGGIPRATTVRTGATADEFWAALWTACGSAERSVVLCPRLAQSLSLLGAWERIDAGRVCLRRYPLLLSDPPSALSVSRTVESGSVLLLDSRNYAIEVGTGRGERERLGDFARDMVSALARAGLGSLQTTAGAQALYGYRRSYMPIRPYTHMHAGALALERAALRGGRSECYRLGRVDGPVYALDWTGFYASIMSEIAVPVRLSHYGDVWPPHGPALLRGGVPMIARVRVRTEWPHLPFARQGLTIYPVGEWWTVLAGPDLVVAHAAGEIVQGGEWASYDTAPALRDYARAMTALRDSPACAENKLLRTWAKALAVTLVGKWSQTVHNWEDRPDVRMPGRWGHWPYRGRNGHWTRWRSVAGRAQVEVAGGETPTSFPAISAWIYAEGRRRLWGAQLLAGRDHVIYSNTDSLFVSEEGYQRLLRSGMIGSGEPGRLRLVDVFPWIELLGISHYRTPGRTVCSGWVGSGTVGSEAEGQGWYGETAGVSLAGRHAPRPFERRAPKERAAPYLHGVRGVDGRVSPWRV